MATEMAELTQPNVLVLEPNAALRAAILTVLAAERYRVTQCDSLEHVLAEADGSHETVALVAWQSMEGLLAEEHRHHLAELGRRVRLVVMVPRRWARLLAATDLTAAIAGLVSKPFEADELIAALKNALPVTASAS